MLSKSFLVFSMIEKESWTIRSLSSGMDLAAERDPVPALWPCNQYPRQPVEAHRRAVQVKCLTFIGWLNGLKILDFLLRISSIRTYWAVLGLS
jgi:hypothetical protein